MRSAASAMSAIRAEARRLTGRDDDATCFALATLLWLGECQDGFHRAPPVRISELRLDDGEPIQ